MTDKRRLRFVGPFDARSGTELEQIATFVVRRIGTAQGPEIVLDLSCVTRIDTGAVNSLNRAWAVLVGSGCSVDVVAPEQNSARWPFLDAAIRGEFAWTRGSTAPQLDPLARTSRAM